MSDTRMKVSFHFKIQRNYETVLEITVSDDRVPDESDAVAYLRDRINHEFERVTGQIPLPKEDE